MYAACIKIPGIISGGFLTGMSLTDCFVTVVMVYTRNTLCEIIRGHGICNIQKRQEERISRLENCQSKVALRIILRGVYDIWRILRTVWKIQFRSDTSRCIYLLLTIISFYNALFACFRLYFCVDRET